MKVEKRLRFFITHILLKQTRLIKKKRFDRNADKKGINICLLALFHVVWCTFIEQTFTQRQFMPWNMPGVKWLLRFTNFVLLLNYYIPSWKGMVLRLTKMNTLTTSFVLNFFEFDLLLREKTVFTFWQCIFHIYYFPLKKSIAQYS